MKAYWLFAKNINDGTGVNKPDLPVGLVGSWVIPGDIVRLTGSGVPHHHLLVGGIALPNDNLGDGHRHYVVNIGSEISPNWQSVTVGAANHTHDIPLDLQGNLMSEFFMLFWVGPDGDVAMLEAHPGISLIVEAPVSIDPNTGGQIVGELDTTPWTTQERTTWETRVLSILGVQLPVEVDRGKRLVTLFLGVLLSRIPTSEQTHRIT